MKLILRIISLQNMKTGGVRWAKALWEFIHSKSLWFSIHFPHPQPAEFMTSPMGEKLALPKTKSSPLKIGRAPKGKLMNIAFQKNQMFQGYVSFREGKMFLLFLLPYWPFPGEKPKINLKLQPFSRHKFFWEGSSHDTWHERSSVLHSRSHDLCRDLQVQVLVHFWN